jgi:AraC-like DNA-binding protein
MHPKPARPNSHSDKPRVEELEQYDRLYIGFTFNILTDPNTWILKDWSWPPHHHTYIELIVPLGITGEITINGIRHPVHDTSVYCILPGLVHTVWFKRHTTNRCCIVRVNPVPFDLALSKVIGGDATLTSHLAGMSAVHTKKADMIRDLIFQLSNVPELPDQPKPGTNDPAVVLADLSIFSRIFSLLLQEKAAMASDISQNEWTRKTLSVIDTYADRSGSLEEIARKCNMSLYHFCRKFKRATGITVLQYLNQMRINRAKYLLSEAGLSVTDTCFETGFGNVSHFIKVFTGMVGQTPKQWLLGQNAPRAKSEAGRAAR